MRRSLALLLAGLVAASGLLAGPVGALAAGDGPRAAADAGLLSTSATVELDAALDDQEESASYSFTFTPASNTTVEATDSVSRSGGDVSFVFDRWERTDGAASGTDNVWEVVAGVEYRVYYVGFARSGASETTYSVTVEDVRSGTFSESLSLTVDYLHPQFGAVDQPSSELLFERPEATSTSLEAPIRNVGKGVMVPDAVSVSDVPSGLTVKTVDVPDRVDPDSTSHATLEVTADADVDPGEYYFTVTVTDNLGNVDEYQASVVVRKPPVADTKEHPLDLGDVLVGQSVTRSFTIQEQLGEEGIRGVEVSVLQPEQRGSISFDGGSAIWTSPGGEDTMRATVDVDEGAPQHQTLSWKVGIQPSDEHSPERIVTVEARVIYPATLGQPAMEHTELVFDEPKSQVSTVSEQVDLSVPNEGDLEMEVRRVTATVDSTDITAEVASAPSTVAGLETGQATVVVTADDDTPEGTYPMTVTVETYDAGTKTIEREVRVEHEVDLEFETNEVEYGEVIVTKRRTESITVSERLGYEDVQGLEITKVAGPDKWLTVVERPPSRLEAGGEAVLVYAVEFDTAAELYEPYEWTFRVTGDNVETRNVTVRATPKPYSLEGITEPLADHEESSSWRSEVATGSLDALRTLESELRSGGDVGDDDLVASIAAGRSTLLFVDSLAEARSAQAEGNFTAAQRHIVRAGAARDALATYVAGIENDEIRGQAARSLRAANESLEAVVERQASHYREQLTGNATTIERARLKANLAQLAEIDGRTERASQLRAESNQAFDSYQEQLEEANERRREGSTVVAALVENATLTLAGQPLELDPRRFDAVSEGRTTALQRYDDAVSVFERAGAETQADAVREERAAAADTLTALQWSLYGATGAYAAGFGLLVVRLTRNALAYVHDARAATTGDFLSQMER